MNNRVGVDADRMRLSDAERDKSAREQAERFLQVFVAHVQAVAAPLLEEQAEPTSPAVVEGALPTAQPAAAAPSTNATEGGADSLTQARMILSVQAGELGELKVVVDRSETGLSLRFGVENAAAAHILQAERGVLERALSAQGLTLKSLSIVPAAGFGTVLAPEKDSAAERSQNLSRFVDAESHTAERRRLARKLNLIG